MSKRQTACNLKVSQSLLSRMLKSCKEIRNALPANESSDGKRKRANIEEKVEEAWKQWFTKGREKDARVTGPPLHLKAKEFANKMRKKDFVYMYIFFYL